MFLSHIGVFLSLSLPLSLLGTNKNLFNKKKGMQIPAVFHMAFTLYNQNEYVMPVILK